MRCRATPDPVLAASYMSVEVALTAVAWQEVDVLLADLELPGFSGVGLIVRAVRTKPALLPMAHTRHDDRDVMVAALSAGACGYVPKGGTTDEFLRTVREVGQGRSPNSPAVAMYLIMELHVDHLQPWIHPLSPRQAALLRWVAAGRWHKTVASDMGIRCNTLRAHVKLICGKLHATHRQQAITRARLLGDLHVDPD